MIIISKFHDYYDGVAKTGVDTSLRYIRNKIKIEDISIPANGGASHNAYINILYIGFCNKIYFTVSCLDDCKYHYYYKDEDVAAFCERRKIKYQNSIANHFKLWNEDYLINFDYTGGIREQTAAKDIFEKYKSPIFTIKAYSSPNKNNLVTLNDCLKQYEFYRKIEPYTAYQEIRMWLSNQAAPEKSIPHIPDDIMAQAKGFNKYSFRKDKSK